MSVVFHNLMKLFIIQKKVCGKLSSTKALTYALSSFQTLFFQPVVFVAHAERIIKWTTLMPSWIYSSSNEKRKSAIQKLQMKNTNWSFQILMIFHEFSLLNFLWSCRHFILFSKISPSGKFFQKISIFQNPEFSEKIPTKNIARRTDGKNTEKTNSGTNDKIIWQNW